MSQSNINEGFHEAIFMIKLLFMEQVATKDTNHQLNLTFDSNAIKNLTIWTIGRKHFNYHIGWMVING